jgi:hypothetical protein
MCKQKANSLFWRGDVAKVSVISVGCGTGVVLPSRRFSQLRHTCIQMYVYCVTFIRSRVVSVLSQL